MNRFAIFDFFLAALAFTGAALIVGACVGFKDFAFLFFLPALVVVDGLAVVAVVGAMVGLAVGLAVVRLAVGAVVGGGLATVGLADGLADGLAVGHTAGRTTAL